MSDKLFTEEQSAAIAERRKTLLLSAAAGSGKTATLTERIIASLTDRESPADIARMLIVTFTRAAASELRERIEAAIRRALAKEPENRHLSRQLLLLPTAEISTIDSFCSRIVRSHAESLGLSPMFRVPDETEAQLLSQSVMEDLIGDGYEGALPFVSAEGFIAFCEEIAGVRRLGDLSAILLKVYADTGGFAEGCAILSRYAEMQKSAADAPIFETPYGRRIAEDVGCFIDHYEAAYNSLCEDLSYEAPVYQAVAEADLLALSSLRSALCAGYTEARTLFEKPMPLKKFPPVRGERPPIDAVFRKLRDTMKSDYKSKCQVYFAYSAEEFRESFLRASQFSALFSAFMQEFERRFGEEKRRRSICDYGDLERYAYRLLYQDGKRTPLAVAISEGYDYIYIDEYQDTNSMQDAIFSAIARSDNRFLVGDVKQSIYGFRGAEPSIFAEMKRAFPKLCVATDSDRACVDLSQNFRCDAEIIDFTNAVFDKLFGEMGESIAYQASDRLRHGKRGHENRIPVTVAVFPPRDEAAPTEAAAVAEAETDTADAPEESESLLSSDPEIRYIAAEIRRLLDTGVKNDGTRIRPGDIAVILRSARKNAAAVAEAIRRAGVAVTAETDRSFFLSPEILLAVALLSVIDNPEKDIPLAACLRSPIYGFTMQELLEIRMAGEREDSLYAACLSYAEAHPEDEKMQAFLDSLAGFRRVAEGVTVDRLLSRLYAETGLLSLAGRGSEGEQNLLLLYDYARAFEGASFRGLYSFLAYVNELIAEGKSLPKEPSADKSDAVHVMTVHHSKGLEYPVVFLARAGAPYNKSDSRAPLVFSPMLGVATRFRDPSGLALIDNPVRRLTLEAIYDRQKEEELRLLYVAFTRARERLYVTGKALPTSSLGACLEKGAQENRFFSRYVAKNLNTYLGAVLATVPENAPFLCVVTPNADGSISPIEEKEEAKEKESSVSAEELCRRYDFVYPYAAASKLPGKISVSHLSPTLLDESASAESELLPLFPSPISEKSAEPSAENAQNAEAPNAEAPDAAPSEAPAAPPRLPAFLEEEQEPGGARRGTATHLFLQFADYGRLRESGAEAECRRLYENGFLTREDADMVYLDEIAAFLSSELFSALLSAKCVRREIRFHATLPAAAFASDGETKKALENEVLFTQGVIDCIIEKKGGGYLLVDYKTDRPTPYERSHREVFRRTLRERHTLQLSYYAAATERIFGAPPERVLVYSSFLGESLDIDVIPLK